MITSALINIFTSFFGFFIGLLPDATLPSGIISAITSVGQFVGLFSWMFPMDTLYLVAVSWFFVEGTIMILKIGIFLYNKARGSG